MTNRKIEYWVIPPHADGEFVAQMEEVLETYGKPYNPACPVLCMDEQPVQLLKETRTPIPATARHGKRVDYEYERAGTANIFMFAEPLAGWREVAVRETKTRLDWAAEMARLLRASTEFEAHCKGILAANGFTKSGNWTIRDYYKLNASNRLSDYELGISIWYEGRKLLKPFEDWRSGETLTWYRDYNAVKHDRSTQFRLANLGNVVTAVAGVLAILFSQFYIM